MGPVDGCYMILAFVTGFSGVVRKAWVRDYPSYKNENYWLSVLVLWIARVCAINAAFMYHSVLSLVPLTWVLHSANGGSKFEKWTEFVYLPLISFISLWYYILNLP